jgi:long-chain fatty acid transport protein
VTLCSPRLLIRRLARRTLRLDILTLLLVVCSVPRVAHAGSLYLMPRGVEAAGRAGARVAGSDDPQALWYNPAGLVASGRQLLVDTLLPIGRTEFTRHYDSGEVAPTVKATSLIPIPTLGYTDNFGLRKWGFGAALMIPPGWGGKFPVSVDGRPAPQRYSILDADDSYIGSLVLGAAYRPIDSLSIGAAVYLTAVQVGATVAVSACDYAICGQPEGMEWEGRARMLLGPIFTASAVFGATYSISWVKIGASLALKTKVKGDAQFDISLPDQKVFDEVTITNADGGDELLVGTAVALPMIARVGVEIAPINSLRIELGATWENWGKQDSIVLDPHGITAHNVPGVGDVTAEKMEIALNMRDTWAVQLGGRYELSQTLQLKKLLALNAGLMFETSAYDLRDLSATALDSNKVMIGLGASVGLTRNVFLDVTYGHIFMRDQTVSNSRVLLPGAGKPDPDDEDPDNYEPGDQPTIGNGHYAMEADFVGLGVRWLLDPLKP